MSELEHTVSQIKSAMHASLMSNKVEDETCALIDRLAAAIRADEREKCAVKCETNKLLRGGNGPNFSIGWGVAIESCAAAIRAGSESAGRSEG